MEKNLFEKAAAWIGSQKKDFGQGLAILQESGFRPGVVRKLAHDGANGPSAAERLEFNMREFVKAYGIKGVPDTDAELHVFDGKESPVDTPEEKQLGIMATAAKVEKGELKVENTATLRVIHVYADAYRSREKAIRLMAEVGEQNDDKSMAQRKKFSDEIDVCTALMERLYPLYEKYQSGADISEKEIENAMKDDSSTSSEKSVATVSGAAHTSEATEVQVLDDFEGKSREELVQLKKNAASRIIKAKNKLVYQSEKKGEKPNPMPAGPKRVKLEAKISNEEKLIEAIDMAIAKFG